MKKFLYIVNYTFSVDLLFWIVIDNLFLSTVKGLTDAQIVAISLISSFISLLIFPLVNYIISRLKNRASIMISSILLFFASLTFTLGNSVYWFAFASVMYSIAGIFGAVRQVMLKNNLNAVGEDGEYVKIRSFAKLLYAVITCVIAIFCGALFNVNPYIPMICCLTCALIGLIFAILYKEDEIKVEEKSAEGESKTNEYKIKKAFDFSILKTRVIILSFLLAISFYGCLNFLHTKASLLAQNIMTEAGITLARISIGVSVIIFISRVCRVVSNILFPIIYKKVKNKQSILIACGIAMLLSSISFAVGANCNMGLIARLVFVCIGLMLIISIRDIYSTMREVVIMNALPEHEHKTAFTLLSFFDTFGSLIISLTAFLLLLNLSLSVVYLIMIIFTISQMVLMVPYSKYLKGDNIKDLHQ